jgi:hypothetical protein
MSTREAMQQALDVLECHADIGIKADKAIELLKQELEKPEPEPVGYLREEDVEHWKRGGMACLYSTPSGIASFAFPVYRREDL